MSLNQLLGRGVTMLAVVITAGCMTVSDSQPVVQSSNAGQTIANKKIALLPIKMQSSLAPDSVTAIRTEISRRLGPALQVKLPRAAIVDIAASADQLNQKNALPLLEQLAQTYDSTGVFDRQKVAAIGQTLGVNYLLISRLKVEKMDLVISKGMGGSLDLSIVDVSTGQIAWGGAGEWKRGGVLGFGGATSEEAANGLITQALAGLR